MPSSKVLKTNDAGIWFCSRRLTTFGMFKRDKLSIKSLFYLCVEGDSSRAAEDQRSSGGGLHLPDDCHRHSGSEELWQHLCHCAGTKAPSRRWCVHSNIYLCSVFVVSFFMIYWFPLKFFFLGGYSLVVPFCAHSVYKSLFKQQVQVWWRLLYWHHLRMWWEATLSRPLWWRLLPKL